MDYTAAAGPRTTRTRATGPPGPSEIPESLERMRRWMGTVFEPRKGTPGKVDKPPYRVVDGLPIIKADKTAPENWATFDEAVAACERGAVDAIGFVITGDDPLFGGDLDDVLDLDTGEIHPDAVQVIHALNTYSEISCSGRGVRIIGTGRKPTGARCKSRALGFDMEVYDGHSGARFMVMTGNRYPGAARDVANRQAELEKLCCKLWPEEPKRKPERQTPHGGVSIDDTQLLDRARRSKTGARFRALYDRGDTGRYASQSEADYALINALIFWTAGDRERVIDLFCTSALYRDSEAGKHRGYVAMSVDNALSSYRGSYYRPRRARTEDRNPLKPLLELLLNPAAWVGRRAPSGYKALAALVVHTTERGIVDDDGNHRVRVDTRTLAETAGMSRTTLTNSGLPYLLQELGILRSWSAPRGEKTGGYVLLTAKIADLSSCTNRLSTLPIGTSSQKPEEALAALRTLIRMRSGKSKTAPIARLGMVAMFCAVAYLAAGPRGLTDDELAKRTGRSVYVLLRNAPPGPVQKLFVAGLIEENGDRRRVTPDFWDEWDRELKDSGIKLAERQQRWWHSEDRRKRKKPPRPKQSQEALKRSRQRRAQEMAKAAGSIADLRCVPDPDAELLTMLRDVLRRYPDHRNDCPYWFAATLWADGYVKGRPDRAAVEAVEVALYELRQSGAA